jgi:hypothetical protein
LEASAPSRRGLLLVEEEDGAPVIFLSLPVLRKLLRFAPVPRKDLALPPVLCSWRSEVDEKEFMVDNELPGCVNPSVDDKGGNLLFFRELSFDGNKLDDSADSFPVLCESPACQAHAGAGGSFLGATSLMFFMMCPAPGSDRLQRTKTIINDTEY